MSIEREALCRVFDAHQAASAAWEAWLAAHLEHVRTVAAFRAAVPAPSGKYWEDINGDMRLNDVPIECNRYDADGERCGGDAIAWNAAGESRCAEHADDLEKNR